MPGLSVELAQLMEDLIGDLTAVPQPIEIKLSAADPSVLIAQARKVAAAIGEVPGVVEVRSGVVLAGDALDIRADPAKAALEGVDPDTIAGALDSYLAGTVATKLPRAYYEVGVRIWLPPELRRRDSELPRLPIRAPDGHLFPLGRVASITAETGQPQITRDNLARIVAVTARIEGRDLGSTVAELQRRLDRPGLLAAGVELRARRALRAAADRLCRARQGVSGGGGGRARIAAVSLRAVGRAADHPRHIAALDQRGLYPRCG